MGGLTLYCLLAFLFELSYSLPFVQRDADDISYLKCRDGWLHFHGSCYDFVVSEDRTWDAAHTACKANNAHLVSIQSRREFEFLKLMIERGVEDGGGILMHELWWTAGRKDEIGNWVWDDGTGDPISFGDKVNWYPGEPNNHGGNEDYVDILYMKGEWGMNDAPGDFELRSICEYDLKPNCDEGWLAFDGHCYQFVTSEDRTWSAAQEACRAENAHLLSVDTEPEAKWIEEAITREVEQAGGILWHELWWTAGRKTGRGWIWDLGDRYKSINFDRAVEWYPGEPNNHDGNEYFMDILYKDGQWGMNDAPESFELRSICEYEPNPCEEGWIHYKRSCYKFETDFSTTHDDALRRCKHLGSQLVSIETDEEFHFLQGEIEAEAAPHEDNEIGRELWWTSGRRNGITDQFNWQDSEGRNFPILDSMWYPGEPNNADDEEDYVCILHLHGDWGLNDAPNHFRLRSICEKPL